jgi:hypothetical protein
MKLTPLEGELESIFVAGGRSNVNPTITTRSATVYMEAKWRLIPRKLFVC